MWSCRVVSRTRHVESFRSPLSTAKYNLWIRYTTSFYLVTRGVVVLGHLRTSQRRAGWRRAVQACPSNAGMAPYRHAHCTVARTRARILISCAFGVRRLPCCFDRARGARSGREYAHPFHELLEVCSLVCVVGSRGGMLVGSRARSGRSSLCWTSSSWLRPI